MRACVNVYADMCVPAGQWEDTAYSSGVGGSRGLVGATAGFSVSAAAGAVCVGAVCAAILPEEPAGLLSASCTSLICILAECRYTYGRLSSSTQMSWRAMEPSGRQAYNDKLLQIGFARDAPYSQSPSSPTQQVLAGHRGFTSTQPTSSITRQCAAEENHTFS